MARALLRIMVTGYIFLSFSFSAGGQENGHFMIKPADVQLPNGIAFGEYRRVIEPFENWTLICDENFKTKKKVCNISQTMVDQRGETAFSWSLAATENGKPMMILRVPSSVGPDKDIDLHFSDKRKTQVKTARCDERVCLALMPVGSLVREHIEKGSAITISYSDPRRGVVRLLPTFKGLSKALSAIK